MGTRSGGADRPLPPGLLIGALLAILTLTSVLGGPAALGAGLGIGLGEPGAMGGLDADERGSSGDGGLVTLAAPGSGPRHAFEVNPAADAITSGTDFAAPRSHLRNLSNGTIPTSAGDAAGRLLVTWLSNASGDEAVRLALHTGDGVLLHAPISITLGTDVEFAGVPAPSWDPIVGWRVAWMERNHSEARLRLVTLAYDPAADEPRVATDESLVLYSTLANATGRSELGITAVAVPDGRLLLIHQVLPLRSGGLAPWSSLVVRLGGTLSNASGGPADATADVAQVPTAAVEAGGAVHLVWTTQETEGWVVRHARLGGPQAILDDSRRLTLVAGPSRPAIALDGNERLHLAFSDARFEPDHPSLIHTVLDTDGSTLLDDRLLRAEPGLEVRDVRARQLLDGRVELAWLEAADVSDGETPAAWSPRLLRTGSIAAADARITTSPVLSIGATAPATARLWLGGGQASEALLGWTALNGSNASLVTGSLTTLTISRAVIRTPVALVGDDLVVDLTLGGDLALGTSLQTCLHEAGEALTEPFTVTFQPTRTITLPPLTTPGPHVLTLTLDCDQQQPLADHRALRVDLSITGIAREVDLVQEAEPQIDTTGDGVLRFAVTNNGSGHQSARAWYNVTDSLGVSHPIGESSPISINASQTGELELPLDVPNTLPPGHYQGMVDLDLNDGVGNWSQEIPVDLEVPELPAATMRDNFSGDVTGDGPWTREVVVENTGNVDLALIMACDGLGRVDSCLADPPVVSLFPGQSSVVTVNLEPNGLMDGDVAFNLTGRSQHGLDLFSEEVEAVDGPEPEVTQSGGEAAWFDTTWMRVVLTALLVIAALLALVILVPGLKERVIPKWRNAALLTKQFGLRREDQSMQAWLAMAATQYGVPKEDLLDALASLGKEFRDTIG